MTSSRVDTTCTSILQGVMAAVDTSGLTVKQLAEASGVSERTIIYLRKLTARPSLRVLVAVAQAAGLELEFRGPSRRRRVVINGSQQTGVLENSPHVE